MIDDRDFRQGISVCPYLTFDDLPAMPHWWYFGRCLNCGAYYEQELERDVPGLNSIQKGTETTWADQVDKASIARMPFWIHGAKPAEYANERGETVNLIVLDITVGGSSRKDPRAVITLGRTEQREDVLAYFLNGNVEPIGPCIVYSVPLKGGLTFWRMEEAPSEEDAQAQMFVPEGSGKRR